MTSPEPRHPDQMVMFQPLVDNTFATAAHPSTVFIGISLHRAPKRARCTACGQRRVLFFVGAGEQITGAHLCARCMGIR
jgi:hypothetical protein